MPSVKLLESEYLDFDIVESTDECSILMRPINKAKLGTFPTFWSSDKKTHKGVKLQCGHVFSIAGLFYYWTQRRTVLCPLCRQGPADTCIDELSLPRHFQLCVSKRVVLMFESRDKSYKSFQFSCATNTLEVTQLGAIQDFVDYVQYYRVWVTVNNVEYPPSPWVPKHRSWIHDGRAAITMHFMHEIVACMYVFLKDF